MDGDGNHPRRGSTVLPRLPPQQGADDERVPQGREAQGQHSAPIVLPELRPAVVRETAGQVRCRRRRRRALSQQIAECTCTASLHSVSAWFLFVCGVLCVAFVRAI